MPLAGGALNESIARVSRPGGLFFLFSPSVSSASVNATGTLASFGVGQGFLLG